MIKLIAASGLLLSCSGLVAQPHIAKAGKKPKQVCQLIFANPHDSHPFPSVPTVVKDKRFKTLNPRISFEVGEDGNVSNVKIVKGTGSTTVDAALVKDFQALKYKPQPGCAMSVSSVVNIDLR